MGFRFRPLSSSPSILPSVHHHPIFNASFVSQSSATFLRATNFSLGKTQHGKHPCMALSSSHLTPTELSRLAKHPTSPAAGTHRPQRSHARRVSPCSWLPWQQWKLRGLSCCLIYLGRFMSCLPLRSYVMLSTSSPPTPC